MSFAFPWSNMRAARVTYSLVVMLFMTAIVGLTVVNAAVIGPTLNVSNDEGGSTRPRVAQDPNGNVHVVWDSAEGSRVVRYAKGTWNGATYVFGPSVEIANVGGFQYSTPNIAVAPNNTVMVVWSDGTIRLRTWSAAAAVPGGTAVGLTGGIQPSVYPDANSNFHIAWSGDFRLQYCQWSGTACSNRAAFDDTENVGNRPDIAVDSNNNVHIVWDTGQTVNYRTRAAGAANFSGIQPIGGGNSAQIAADGKGNVHIVRSQNFDIYYCSKTIATGCGNQHIMDGLNDVEPSIGATRGGNVAVVFRSSSDVFYDALENGVWQTTRPAGNGFTVDVSARPYTGRLSAVWGQDFDIQHRAINVACAGGQALKSESVVASAATVKLYLPFVFNQPATPTEC